MIQRKRKKNSTKYIVRDVILALLMVAAVVLAIVLAYGRLFGEEEEQVQIALNNYDLEAFYYEDDFLRYSNAPYMIGIDVSEHQGGIDWQAVSEAGVEFVIIRAGYRGYANGSLNEDPFFRANYEGARAAGLKIGIYFFSQACDTVEAREEAQYVCELIGDYEIDLPVFFDWETVEGAERITSEEGIPITQCAIEFCETVRDAGFDAGVYFNQTYGYRYLNLANLQDYTMWLAQYNQTPDFYYNFDYLQYTDTGSIDGISGNVDLNLMLIEE